MVKKKIIRAKIKYSGSSKEEITSDFLPCRGYMNQGNVYKEMRDRLQKMIDFKHNTDGGYFGSYTRELRPSQHREMDYMHLPKSQRQAGCFWQDYSGLLCVT